MQNYSNEMCYNKQDNRAYKGEGGREMKNRTLILMIGSILILLTGCGTKSDDDLIFTDEVIKLISDYYDNADIEILDEVDIDLNIKLRFLEVDQQKGFSIFEKDNEKISVLRNYLFDSTKPFSNQLVPYNQPDQFLYVVYSDGSELTKVQLTINNDEVQTKEVALNKPSLTIFNLNLPLGTSNFQMEEIYYGLFGEEIYLKN